MWRDFCCWERNEDEVRESSEHLIFAGRGREVLSEAVLCRGPYILVPGIGQWGVGVAWEVVGGLWWGVCTARESAKVQASLNGLLLCYVILGWRIEADTLTPSCPGGPLRTEAASSREWWREEMWWFVDACVSVTGETAAKRPQKPCVRAAVHTRAPPTTTTMLNFDSSFHWFTLSRVKLDDS